MEVLHHKSGNKLRQVRDRIFLLIDTTNIDASVSFYESNSMDAIEFNYVRYPSAKSFEFLDRFKDLKALTIISDEGIDITNLIAVKRPLEELSINRPFDQKLDLTLFQKLNYLFIHWNKNIIINSEQTSIETLKVNGYKQKEFNELRFLPNLKRLEILSSSIKSLKGVECLTDLEFFGAYYLRGLETLEELSGLKKIKKIEIQNCPKITDLSPFASLLELEELTINNSKEIDSLCPLKGLKKLKKIKLLDNTKVLDGDMSPLIGLEFAAFENRRHYSHTNEEIDNINGWKEN